MHSAQRFASNLYGDAADLFVLSPQFSQLAGLLEIAHGFVHQSPRIAPLFERRIVEVAAHRENRIQRVLLSGRGLEPNLVGAKQYGRFYKKF
jgi:hypothetical protein